MAELPIQDQNPSVAPVFTAADAAGDEFGNDGTGVIFVIGGAGRTITVQSPHPGQADYARVLPTASTIMPRFDPVWWNDRDGHLHLSFDDVAGVQVAVLRMGVIQADPDAAPLPGLF